MSILSKIISGGQTGVDIAALDAAIKNNFPYGGYIPKGRKTESGSLPLEYKLTELNSASYPKRTELNVKESDGTVIFTHTKKLMGGSRLTADLAESWGKPWIHFDLSKQTTGKSVTTLVNFVKSNKISVLNVAGSRQSKDPIIYDKVFCIVKKTILKFR